MFEVWADVARRYKLDPDWTVITGYSMGGIGTFKLAEQFPDLFARAQPTVGDSEDNEHGRLAAQHPGADVERGRRRARAARRRTCRPRRRSTALGYRYELDIYSGEHLTLAIHDQYAPAAEFLGTAKVDRNPPHVTYVVDPSLDHADLGFVADHAYWLSGARTRGAGPGHASTRSRTRFGTGDPPASATQFGAGTLGGGNLGTLAFTRQYKTWGPAPPIAKANRIDLTATNVSAVTINPKRAGVELQRRPARDERRAADGQAHRLQAHHHASSRDQTRARGRKAGSVGCSAMNAQPGAGRTAWARNLAAPVRDFLSTETGGAAVLLVRGGRRAAVGELAVAGLLRVVLDDERSRSSFGDDGISQDLRHWVNEGLMTFFFLVLGLEAKRELDWGSCASGGASRSRWARRSGAWRCRS